MYIFGDGPVGVDKFAANKYNKHRKGVPIDGSLPHLARNSRAFGRRGGYFFLFMSFAIVQTAEAVRTSNVRMPMTSDKVTPTTDTPSPVFETVGGEKEILHPLRSRRTVLWGALLTVKKRTHTQERRLFGAEQRKARPSSWPGALLAAFRLRKASLPFWVRLAFIIA